MSRVWMAGLLVGLTAVGCGRGPGLVVYSPHGKEMQQAFEEAFEEAHPTVDVQIMDMGSQTIMDRLRSEKGNPQCDLWWGAPSTMFMQAAEEGLLEAYRPSWADQVAPEHHDARDRWYGTFLTVEVIGFNERLLAREEAPSDWDDLLDERWKDQILLRDPMPSGTMRTIFSAMIWRFYEDAQDPKPGYDWLLKLDANTKAYTANPQDMLQRLAAGEAQLTVWNLTDILLQRQLHGMPLDHIIPSSGTPVVTEGIALIAGAAHPQAARDFYEFVTSEAAVRRQAEPPFFRYPSRRDIPTDTLPEWVQTLEFTEMPLDWSVFVEQQEDWMQYWDERIRNKGR